MGECCQDHRDIIEELEAQIDKLESKIKHLEGLIEVMKYQLEG